MIAITNTQRRFAIDISRIQQQLKAMLDAIDYGDFSVGVLICGEKRMAQFNQQYRNKEGATDILSFPYHTELQPGQRITVEHDDDKNLGDIILCPHVIERKRQEWHRDFDAHLTVLLAHGIAHLLNHDHKTDEQFATMQAVEKKLLAAACR